jgi:serine protease Do
MNNDINENFKKKEEPFVPETKEAPVFNENSETHPAPEAPAAQPSAFEAPRPAFDAEQSPFGAQRPQSEPVQTAPRGTDAPQFPDQSAFSPESAGQSAPDGRYSMPHPANGTTYYRAPQSDAGQRAEWSNTGAPFTTQTGYGAPARPPYGAPQDTRWQTNGQTAPNAPGGAYPRPGYAQPYGQYTVLRGTLPQNETKKDRKGASVAIVAVICAVCVLFSGAAGFFGTRLANRNASSVKTSSGNGSSSVVSNEGGTTVMYRSVSTDSEAKSTATVNDVVNAVADSVVEITTEYRSTGFWQYVQSGAGSGVIITEDGYIVTNNHVIVKDGTVADPISVRLRDGTSYEAKVVGRDEDADIAVIKIDATGLTAAVFGDSATLAVGDDIVAIGNPLGELGGTVTEGIISALDREVDVEGTKMNLLQISAAVNPGNSGGGLFNMKGELVGVVNAKSSGSGIEGLGFAIPSNDANHIAEELIAHGYVTGKPYIGISTYYASDAFTAYRYFDSQATGLYIYEVVKGYNDNVFKKNDRIVEVDGKEIATNDDLAKIIKEAEIGSTLKFTVYREGKRTELDVKVYEYVPEDAKVNFGS